MIKKILLLFILGFSFISFSSAGVVRQIGIWGASSYDYNINIEVISKGSFISEQGGTSKRLLALSNKALSIGGISAIWYWGYKGVPYLFISAQRSSNDFHYNQGHVMRFAYCNEIFGLAEEESNGPGNCTYQNVTDNSPNIFENFLKVVDSTDYYYYNIVNNVGSLTPNGYSEICISSHVRGGSLCFYGGFNGDIYGNGCWIDSQNFCLNLTGGLHYNPDINFLDISDADLYNSPGVDWSDNITGGSLSTGNVVYKDISSNDVTNYFEENQNYNRTPSLCYVGTNDLTSPYGTTGISFNYGNGKTVFELYESLYGTGNYTDNDVGTWINSRMINYRTWFMTSPENRIYLAYWTGGNLIFEYENITFPFANQPVAIYFMSNLYMDNHVGEDGNIGYEMVVYCDNVFNGDNAESINKPYLKNNIDTYTENRRKNTGYYQNPSGEAVWGSGFWSKLDVYNNTGEKTDFASNFKSFYAKLTEKINNVDDTGGLINRIVPEYILGFLALILLFKFLRKF